MQQRLAVALVELQPVQLPVRMTESWLQFQVATQCSPAWYNDIRFKR